MIRKIILAFALLLAMPVHAEWREATSANFVVYSEGGEAELRDFIAKLEKFNFVLRSFHGVTAAPSPNRLRVFLMPSVSGVQRYAGGAAGFYIRRARGPMMVGTRTSRSNARIDSESILLHEYTHHFMFQYFPASYPTWYSEGFAEFWGATRFLDNDLVEVGLPVEYRYQSLVFNRWLPARRLLTIRSYADTRDVDLIYAQGWLLVRMMFDDPDIHSQIQAYLNAINAGRTYRQAAEEAIPDLDRFNSRLFNYASRRRFSVLQLPFRAIDVGEITVRTVSPAEQALMHHEIRLSQGILASDAAEVAGEIRQIATRFPDDPFALRMVAEAERLAGDNAAALEAVNHLLAVQPDDPRGLMHRGMIEAERLRDAGSNDQAAWDAARQFILRANRAAPNDPLVLEAYHDSFTLAGQQPPDAAQNALYMAMERAPSDYGLRYKVAADFEARGMIEDALAVIRPAAYVAPHRDDETERERQRRERLQERYRMAGTTVRESPREMYDRLRARLGLAAEEDEEGAAETAAD